MASLIYHTGALGDFVTTLPAMELWKREHSRERLILLGRPAHGALARRLVDETWDAASARFSSLFSSEDAGGIRVDPLAGITSALVFAAASSPLWKAVGRLGLPDAVRQDPFPAGEIHVVDYHLELFPGRVREEDRVPRIHVAGPGAWAKTAALHHGSGSPKKNWPRDRFEALAGALSDRGRALAWITGPAEEGVPRLAQPRGAQEWRSLDLAELAERLGRCGLFVGNDSGVTHLAAAVGCPTVALFGAPNDTTWAPRGPRVRIVRSRTGRMEDIPLVEVLGAALDLVGIDR